METLQGFQLEEKNLEKIISRYQNLRNIFETTRLDGQTAKAAMRIALKQSDYTGYLNVVNQELVVLDEASRDILSLEKNTHARFSLVHLDMDVYEPTSSALTDLWPRIVRGGIVVIDDYNTVGGATRAIDEFLRDKNIRLQKLGLNHTPAFFEKP